MTTHAPSPMPEAGMIDMTRTMPPEMPEAREIFQSALQYVASLDTLDLVVQRHRFFGTEGERTLASEWLSDRLGFRPSLEQIYITGGTQNTLQILLPRLCGTEGVVATEMLSYAGIPQICALYGIRVVGIEIDELGIIPEAFRAACRREKIKVLYCNPTIHNPTTSILPIERRREIAEIAREFGVSIIEDDVHGKLVEGAPAPIASIAPGITWYLMSVSKCIGMGLRAAFLVAPSPQALVELRSPIQSISSWFVPGITAAVVAHLIETGAADHISTIIRREVELRQTIASNALAGWTMQTKPNALHMWLDLPEHLSVVQLVEAVRARNVLMRPSDLFNAGNMIMPNSVRLSLVAPKTKADLQHAVTAISDALKAMPTSRPTR